MLLNKLTKQNIMLIQLKTRTMKRIVTSAAAFQTISKCLVSAAIVLLSLSPASTIAQEEKTKAETEKEEPAKTSPSLEFIVVQKGDNTLDFKSKLQAKINGSNKKLPHLKINFIAVKGGEETPLGSAITDVAGKALFNCKSDLITSDESGNMNVKAVFAGNNAMESAEEELTLKKAKLEITPVAGDTLYSVKVRLVDVSSGSVIPVPDVALGIYVHRYFNPLKVAEATTDANGEATAVVPFNLPGDENGNLQILVKLDEHELYGNMESSVTQKWGLPMSWQKLRSSRALWTAHPPMWMLVTFIILVTVVWGHYIVIIYELFRLRKEEPHPKA